MSADESMFPLVALDAYLMFCIVTMVYISMLQSEKIQDGTGMLYSLNIGLQI